jgi:hypothetical protein
MNQPWRCGVLVDWSDHWDLQTFVERELLGVLAWMFLPVMCAHITSQWIGLREILQEKPLFNGKIDGFL